MAEEQPQEPSSTKLFGKWSFDDIEVSDLSLNDLIMYNKHPVYVPHTAGRYQKIRFKKATCPVVERMCCSLMMHGRNNGKKLMAMRIIHDTLEIINLLTDKNPV